MYGSLTLICGPMFSGKTTELLKNILWQKNGLNKNVLVYKTSFDDRYAHEEVMNHDGLQAKALSIKTWDGNLPADTDVVFFDEVQFFDEPQFDGNLVQIVHDLLSKGVDVYGAGLDMDAEGLPFEITAKLMAMSDKVIKLQSICAVCGQHATKTFRFVKETADGQVQLGGSESYEPRCTKHWSSGRVQSDLFVRSTSQESISESNNTIGEKDAV